jgi:hypothetical protein
MVILEGSRYVVCFLSLRLRRQILDQIFIVDGDLRPVHDSNEAAIVRSRYRSTVPFVVYHSSISQ